MYTLTPFWSDSVPFAKIDTDEPNGGHLQKYLIGPLLAGFFFRKALIRAGINEAGVNEAGVKRRFLMVTVSSV